MTPHQHVTSLAALGDYRASADVWSAHLSHPGTGNLPAANRFQDERERLGDQAAVENLVDALETAK